MSKEFDMLRLAGMRQDLMPLTQYGEYEVGLVGEMILLLCPTPSGIPQSVKTIHPRARDEFMGLVFRLSPTEWFSVKQYMIDVIIEESVEEAKTPAFLMTRERDRLRWVKYVDSVREF